MVEPVALFAVALDAAIGWPDRLYRRIGHPVGIFAWIIRTCEVRWNRPDYSPARRTMLGVATVGLLLLFAGGTAGIIQQLSRVALGSGSWIVVAVFAWPALAQRSLFDHVRAVACALTSGDLSAARVAVGLIVGRETRSLDEAGVSRAAIESLAESFCDGVVAPLFWLFVFGLPGIWLYKAINTADSMIGHREERWRAFGGAAARLDDACNVIPARLAAILICLAGAGGWRTLWRDASKHASPNAGWPEAAMAGVLSVRIAGPVRYDGVVHAKLWIGDGQEATCASICHALVVYIRACGLLWGCTGVVIWAL